MQNRDIIFFDIETVSGQRSYDELSTPLQIQRERKAQRLMNEDQSASQLYTDKAAIFAEFGKIICISYGRYHQDNEFVTHSFVGTNEQQLLRDFFSMLEEYPHYCLCGHNSKEFDIPYLCRRALIHGLPLPRMLQLQGKKPREIPHLDTMELWKFGDYKSYTSLALLCAVFDISTPKDDIDGSQVSSVFREQGDVERIARYCEKDVVATAKVYGRLVNE